MSAMLSRKQRRAARRQRVLKLGGVFGGGAVLLAAAGLFLLGSNSSSQGPAAPSASPTAGALVAGAQPTAHPRLTVGALAEGAIALPDEAPAPPSSELRANGGARFSMPLAAFAGIDDWFGTPRQYGMIHGGVDFGLEGLGSLPVRSACNGTVSETGADGPYGPHVTVDCGAGWTTLYAYLGSLSIAVGTAVNPATQIGTSDSEDLFLHFEIRWQGVPVDPADYLALPPRRRPEPTPTPAGASGVPTRPRTTTGGAVAPENPPTPTPNTTASTSTPGPTSPRSTATSVATASPTATATNTPTATPTPRAVKPTPKPPVILAP
jgi:murein DD-endopeptidase MepM/ murein hydrolase activator NlpD